MSLRINEGYIITGSIHIGEYEFVLGVHQHSAQNFVTWRCNGGDYYYWGHYFSKYVSELLGKATIDTNTYGKSTGRNGNYSTNFQITGRELLDAAEVRLLDNQNAILFIRGEKPVLDEKYNILKHPKVALTADGKAEPYQHGTAENAVATVSFAQISESISFAAEETETMYELLSDEELEEKLNTQEERNHVKQENH